MSDLLQNLNSKQIAAVEHPTGPALVLAGAGSGKTTVLTTRAMWLIQNQNVAPESLLLVTFTNKAAGEIKARIEQKTGNLLPFSGTFHSLCAKILRRDGYHIGLDPNFVIYDTDDQTALLKLICKQHGIDTTRYSINSMRATISSAKNELLLPDEYRKLAKGPFQEHVARLYTLYQNELAKAQAVDFDDLLLKTLDLLKQNPTTRQKYQSQFSHVLVDEYQDTNKAQYQLTKIFAQPQNNLFVVGDFSQSIYAWRGADYHNMLELKNDFANIKEYRLDQNYRSNQNILDAATQVISQNRSHPILELWTTKQAGEQIVIFEASSAQAEAFFVVKTIASQQTHYPYEDMAVLYRTNAQSRVLEEAFMKAGIPYTLVGGTKFYERSEVKDVLAYLKYLVNPSDLVSYERILGLGKRRFEKYRNWSESLHKSPAVANHDVANSESSGVTPSESLAPAKLIKGILDSSGYLEKFEGPSEENLARIENISELVNTAVQFETVSEFLENVALVQDAYFADKPNKKQARGVSLMSFHSAKGLEFSLVFMVGMEEGLLPHSRSLLSPDDIEEERRLCYVGITRAKTKLHLSFARTRYQYGVSGHSLQSRFLRDISSDLTQLQSDDYSSFSFEKNRQQAGKTGWAGQSNNSLPDRAGRRYVPIDDDTLDGVLSGEIDVDALIRR